ncbi:glycoside hydrolase family 88 protein [Paenibacillus sp. BR2-3]|uniref:glycoside hydrolase family 88 protein n=1 Tax=Paenibacillus sp. BR2-3 TaxID=3048494 RepID=UPI00397762C6
MILQYVTYPFIAIGFIVIAIDLLPLMKDWLGRIRIGRYEDTTAWNQSMVSLGMAWLKRMPKIKVTDNTRLIVLDMIKGNYSKAAIQHWQEAALLLGLSEYLQHNDDPEVKAEIQHYLHKHFDMDGQWRKKPEHIDAAILAYALMKLNFIDKHKYRRGLDYVWDLLKEHLGEDGTVQYRKYMKSYRYVDTIGFICPFLIAYGREFGQEECIELAVKQITEYEKHGLSEKYDLPCHAYRLEDLAPLGIYGWGRGLGWYAIGLIDAWTELPGYHKHKQTLEQSVSRFAKAVMRYQQASGAWNWTVTRQESRPDSSATATLGWFLLNAVQIGELSEECLKHADLSMKYLMKVTRRNGAIDFSQGDTKDIGVYSMTFNILPFAQGFSVRGINMYLNTYVGRRP